MKISFTHTMNCHLAAHEQIRGLAEPQRIVDAIRHPTAGMDFDKIALVALDQLQQKLVAEPLGFTWPSVAATITLSKRSPTLTLAIESPGETAVPVGTWPYVIVNGEYFGISEAPWEDGEKGSVNFLYAALRQAWEQRLRVAA